MGLRMERYDANQLVMKDQYSLYPIRTVGEVKELNGLKLDHPTNIGNDFAVYVNDMQAPTKIIGYRNGDRWFNADGSTKLKQKFTYNKTDIETIPSSTTNELFKDLKSTVIDITQKIKTDYFNNLISKSQLKYSDDLLKLDENGMKIYSEQKLINDQKIKELETKIELNREINNTAGTIVNFINQDFFKSLKNSLIVEYNNEQLEIKKKNDSFIDLLSHNYYELYTQVLKFHNNYSNFGDIKQDLSPEELEMERIYDGRIDATKMVAMHLVTGQSEKIPMVKQTLDLVQSLYDATTII
jgi:hypothetical protein